MSILNAILAFTCSSITGGITWDILKKGGQKLIDSFKKRFAANKYFENENKSEEYLKRLALTECISKNNPYANAGLVYEDLTGKTDSDGFNSEFEKWILENKQEFENVILQYKQFGFGFVKVENQTNFGSGKIVNAGVYNEY